MCNSEAGRVFLPRFLNIKEFYVFDFGIVDGNYFLRRNFSAAKTARTLLEGGSSSLTRSFLSTAMNYKEKLGFKKMIIVWDKLPYIKLADITEYKQDRTYATQEQIDELNKQIELETNINKKNELVLKRENLQYDLDCEKAFSQAKWEILENFVSSKIINMRILGYEADDLAYLISSHLSKRGESCILITADSDWLAFVQSNVTVYRESRKKNFAESRKFHHIDNSLYMAEAEELQCSVYEVGNLMEAYTGGHNNVDKYTHAEIPFIEFARKLLKHDLTLPDCEYFWKRVAALNINNYDNKVVYDTFDKTLNKTIADEKARNYLRGLSHNLLERYLEGEPDTFGGFVL